MKTILDRFPRIGSRLAAVVGIAVLTLVPQMLWAQAKILASYSLPDLSIAELQNSRLPGTVANDRKIKMGGTGSDLWRGPNDPKDEYWMMTDRGPNGQHKVDGKNRRTFPIPEFSPMILRVKTEGGKIRILDAIPITGQSGKAVTGLSNIEGVDETPYDYTAQKKLEFNPNGLDPEGLVRTRAGEFWIVEEYSPSLLHLDRTGKVLKRYIPKGVELGPTAYPVSQTLPAIYGKRKTNRGFEGLALSHDEKALYIVLQSPLSHPDRKIGNNSRNTRILAFDIPSERAVAEYVYRFDVAKEFDPGPEMKPSEMKVSAVTYIGPNNLLVLERTDSVAKIYSVDLSKATDILNGKWGDVNTNPTLESLADPAGAGVKVLPKTLVVDLSLLKEIPGKVEGVVILDRTTIAVANDNDFGTAESKYDDEGNSILSGVKSRLWVVSLPNPLGKEIRVVQSE